MLVDILCVGYRYLKYRVSIKSLPDYEFTLMLQYTWREIEHRLDVLRATNKAQVEIY